MFTLTTGKLTSGNRSVPRSRRPMSPRTRIAIVIMTVKTGRRIATAERFIGPSVCAGHGAGRHGVAVLGLGRRVDHDDVVRVQSRADENRSVGARVKDHVA